MLRRILSSIAWSAVALLSVAVHAQGTFPTKGVRIIVPQTPGGASDALARIIAQKLGERWSQSVVVDNRPGAGGNIGMDLVAKSPADGYTLLLSYVGTHAINGSLYKKLPFDIEKDFVPVATLATVPFVVVTHPNVPVKNVQELAALAKTRPVHFGSAGNGSVNHLLGEMFSTAAGVKLTHVPYKGAAPAMADLMGGQIQVVFTSMPSVAQQVRSGSLRALAVTSAKRSATFKDIPTIAESGYPGFDVDPWFGLFAPGGLPAPILKQINADVSASLKARDTIDKFSSQGAEPYDLTPEAFATLVKADIAKWARVVKASGATLD